jgi:adenylate cyclase
MDAPRHASSSTSPVDSGTLKSGVCRMKEFLLNPRLPLCGLILAVLFFPFAAWRDFESLMNRELSGHATLMDTMITETRQLYSDRLSLARTVYSNAGAAKTGSPLRFGGLTLSDLQPRAVLFGREVDPFDPMPVPASFSIQLANRLTTGTDHARFDIVSDYPFRTRAARALTPEETQVLTAMRAERKPHALFTGDALSSSGLTLYSPIIMNRNCADCHNQHPDSQKHDWRAGDVRGIQVVALRPAKASVFSRNSSMLADFAALIGFCGWLYAAQSRQQRIITGINAELNQSRNFLTKLSGQLAKYIPPQIHRALAERKFDVDVATDRTKLTVLFADVVDFTSMSERLQPEELTHVMNAYFDELSTIAERHGGTVNKFIGDAVLVFFGHPDSHGERADANACFAAAREMIESLPALNERVRQGTPWLELRLRIGLNTGICNVGNFGSSQRLDYTVIGAEVNVAARVIKAARPNTIALTENTFACIDCDGKFEKLPAQSFKGVSHDVAVYLYHFESLENGAAEPFGLRSEGLAVELDPKTSDLRDLRTVRTRLDQIIRRRESGSGN